MSNDDLKDTAERVRDLAMKEHPEATVIVMIAAGPKDSGSHYVAHSGGTEGRVMTTLTLCTARLKEALAEATGKPPPEA